MKRFSVKKLVASVSLLMVSALMPTLSLADDSCDHLNVANGQCQSCYCGVFYYTSTKEIVLPNNWGENMWGPDAEFIKSIDIEGNRRAWIFTNPITRIPDGIFGGKQELISLEIPYGVTYVGSGFGGCNNLESVSFPGTIKSIPDGIFGGCNKLNKVEIASGVETVGASAFAGCNNLTDVVIGSSVKVIGPDAFPAGVQFTVKVTGDEVPQINRPYNVVFGDDVDFATLSKYSNIASIKYTRNVTSDWGTLCLPFDVKSSSNIQYYELVEIDLDTDVMVFATLDEVKANTPCVFAKLTQETNVDFSSSKFNVTNPKPVKNLSIPGWSMVGTYEPLDFNVNDASDVEYYGKNIFCFSAGKFWQAIGHVKSKPFRAYFEYDGVLPSAAASRFSIEVAESNETGINGVNVEAQEEGVLYDLAGNRVENMVNGQVYILNGKKVMFK